MVPTLQCGERCSHWSQALAGSFNTSLVPMGRKSGRCSALSQHFHSNFDLLFAWPYLVQPNTWLNQYFINQSQQ